MPIFSHFPSICPQNFNLRIHDLNICCINIKPVSKMCAVRLLSPGSTHKKLLAESRETITSLQTFSLKMQQVLQRSNNHGCLRVGKSYFSKLDPQLIQHSVLILLPCWIIQRAQILTFPMYFSTQEPLA